MITNLFQPALSFDDPSATQLPVSTPDGFIPVWVDEEAADRLAGRKLSRGSHGYAALWDRGTMVLLHRWIMGAEVRDGRYIDHVNGDRLDCRMANLRWATAQENAANRACTAKSGYRGVARSGKRFTAYGKAQGIVTHLGTYDTPEQAAEVAHMWRVQNLPGYTGDPRTRFTSPTAALIAA
jgi:hypothetical protein